VHRRPTSRSTHYQLTDTEVELLKQDPRVLDIHQPYYDLGMKIVPCVTQTSDYWSKGGNFTQGTPEVNWGLLRCVEGKTRDDWGWNGQTKTVSGTINLPNTGRNVDLVILDRVIRPGHPEFADETGKSRVQDYDWFGEHGAAVLKDKNPSTRYSYAFPSEETSDVALNHGTQCASVAAGNHHGFARGSNIYNLIRDDQIDIYDAINFVTEFHKNKKTNDATGRRNPTVLSMSFAMSASSGMSIDVPTEIRYKGTIVPRPDTGYTEEIWRKVGARVESGLVYTALGRDTSIDEDIRDAIAAGVICVGSAGNDSVYMDIEGGDLYDNRIVRPPSPLVRTVRDYMAGQSPGAAPGVICVGAVDATVEERKAGYSNKGPRVDIYAPAFYTISARNTYAFNERPIWFTRKPNTSSDICTFVSYPRSVNEGSTAIFVVQGTPNATFVWERYWQEGTGPGRANRFDLVDRSNARFSTNASGNGTFSIPIAADMWTEGVETFRVDIFPSVDFPGHTAIATTEPITIVDTSTGNKPPPGVDSRNPDYYIGTFDGTSSACPHVAGIIACALETYPNMTQTQALSYIQTYANHGVLRDAPFNTDYDARQWFNDEYILFNGPNKYATYQPNTRPNQVQPIIGHQSRPLTGAVYPRPRTKRML
jgi:subtilisin family serine protease